MSDTIKQIIADLNDEQKAALETVADDLRDIVESIESRLPTTKDHYGNYLPIISKFPKESRQLIVLALVAAGANESGVTSAAKIAGI